MYMNSIDILHHLVYVPACYRQVSYDIEHKGLYFTISAGTNPSTTNRDGIKFTHIEITPYEAYMPDEFEPYRLAGTRVYINVPVAFIYEFLTESSK